MARFNELLVGRYNRLVQKLFSMKGSASLVTLSDEMFAVLPLFYGAENRYLEGWERFASNPAVAPSAQVSGFRFRNPSGSNVVAVVEKMVYLSTVADAGIVLQGGAATTDLTSTFGTLAFDSRGRTSATISISAGFAPANLTTTGIRWGVGSSVSVELLTTDIHELPVLPGSALQVITSSNTATVSLSWVWRERFLEDSERT